MFGPITPLAREDLAAQLKNWYFEHGWVLTQESRTRYFLVQEVLSFLMLRSVCATRPPEELLFGSESRPVEVLRELRSSFFRIENRGDEGKYSVEELKKHVSEWKLHGLQSKREEDLAQEAWVLLQFVLSTFRSALVKELGSRQNTNRTVDEDIV